MTRKGNTSAILNREALFVLIFLCLLSSQILGSNSYVTATIEITEQSLTKADSSERFEGYNLFVVDRLNATNWSFYNRSLLITDLDGNIYVERELSPTINLGDCPAEFINSTTILYGDPGGTKLWNIETNVTQNLYYSGHHDFEKNHLKSTYFSLTWYFVEIEGVKYAYDMIREYNADGIQIWSMDTRNFIDTSQWCPFEDILLDSRDMTHSNTIFYDEDNDVLYLNSRNQNTFYKIDRETESVVWALGEYGDFTLYDIYGNQRDNLFYHTHSLEMIEENKFLLFDNDFHNQTDATNRHSRLVEITVDEDKMQANVTWEWISSNKYYSAIWGDCDRLPNDNRLGVFGTPNHPNTDVGPRLVEVNYDGELVWEYSFPKFDGFSYGVYRIERFRSAPIVSTPMFIDIGNNSYFEWNVWYNFRSKTNFTGEYFVNIDDQLVDNGSIHFPKYWYPTQVRYYIEDLSVGEHEIGLVVADEGGHLSNESAFHDAIGILQFVISRKLKFILGVSLGVGIPALLGSTLIWLKYLKKIRFRRK